MIDSGLQWDVYIKMYTIVKFFIKIYFFVVGETNIDKLYNTFHFRSQEDFL